MRNRIRVAAATLAALAALGCRPRSPVVGSWSAVNRDAPVRAVALGENGRGWWIGQGRRLEHFRYTVQLDRDPVWIDVYLPDRHVRGIVHVVDGDALRLRLATGSEPRPAEFSPAHAGELYFRLSER